MHVMYGAQAQTNPARRPAWLDLCAAGLLLSTVVLHVVAMFPRYFGGSLAQGSLWSQPDQAALYAVLAAGWALALGLVLAGPARMRLGAAVAVGLAVTELGFRVADLGQALHEGVGQSSTGMWLMTASWVTGAAGAMVATLAVIHRARIDADGDEPSPVPAPVGTAGVEPSAWPPSVASWGGDLDPASAVPSAPVPPPDPGSAELWGPKPDPDQGWAAQWGPESEADTGPPAPWAPAPGPDRPIASGPARLIGSGPARPAPPTPDPAPLSPWAYPLAAPAGTPAEVRTGGDAPLLPVPRETAAAPVDPTTPVPLEPTASVGVDATTAVGVDSTSAMPIDSSPAAPPAPSGAYGVGPTALVAVLALITAGAFLPAWDRYVGQVTTTGRSITFNLGNAFSGPWPLILGNVLVALALVSVPIVATRLRDRAVAASVVAGSLLALAAQFTTAIVQVNQPVPASVVGLTPAQAAQLGLQLHQSLTGWFTIDVLAAYALFVAVMVIGYLRPVAVQENSAGTWASAPEARSPASLPSS
jgi:hypothetical protein